MRSEQRRDSRRLVVLHKGNRRPGQGARFLFRGFLYPGASIAGRFFALAGDHPSPSKILSLSALRGFFRPSSFPRLLSVLFNQPFSSSSISFPLFPLFLPRRWRRLSVKRPFSLLSSTVRSPLKGSRSRRRRRGKRRGGLFILMKRRRLWR